MQWLRAVALVVSAALAIVRPATAREAAPDPVLTVTVLGSGTPVPSRTQAGSAILIQAGGQNLLFDCGRGCTTRLAELDPALVPQVKHLFLTHLHSDHITGIPDLWLNGWTLGRTAPLEIQGPKGTAEMMEHLRKAYARDIAFRLTDRMPASDSGLAPRFTDVLPRGGMIYDREGVKVTAFPVNHGTVVPAYGYRVDYRGRSVVLSGDATVSTELERFAAGADLLLLEVMSPALVTYLRGNFAPKQADTVIGSHLSTEQAAGIFVRAKPRLGVYYHTRHDAREAEGLLAQSRRYYRGPQVVAHDLIQFQLFPERVATVDLRSR